jgi:glutamyl/glutaminyl-tRNA synthetase
LIDANQVIFKFRDGEREILPDAIDFFRLAMGGKLMYHKQVVTCMKEVLAMANIPTGRFAPTPSGRLHLGNILCAMLAYLSARSKGGRFLLRIEDVDIPRCPRHLAQQCIEDLQWLGFNWDGDVIYQSDRSDIYREAIDHLEAQGHIYPCFCTRAQLMSLAAPNLGDTQVIYQRTCANLTPEEQAEKGKDPCSGHPTARPG